MAAETMRVQRHAPIREQVASIVRQAILDHRLAPGQVLVERELCEMTSASRPSVREALRQLQAEGLVESQNGRGTVVTIVSPEVAKQVYEVRAELEGLAAELFCENASDAEVAALLSAFEVLERVVNDGDQDATLPVLEAKNALYDILFRGSGNEILHHTVSTLQRRVNQLRARTLSMPGRPARSLEEIRALVEAARRRDGKEARRAATHHVEEAARTVL